MVWTLSERWLRCGWEPPPKVTRLFATARSAFLLSQGAPLKPLFYIRLMFACAAGLATVAANATPQKCLEDYFTQLFTAEAPSRPAKRSFPKTERARLFLHNEMWPSGMSSRGTFGAMVSHRRFECAELAFNDLDRDGIFFRDGAAKTIALLESAADVARSHRGLSVSEIQQLMEAWKAKAPNSVIVDIYWVRLLNAAAWKARGDGPASQVSPNQWKEFRALNAAAKTRIDLASQQAKAHRLWPYAVRWVVADSGASQQELEDYVFESLKRFPDEVDYLLLPAERVTGIWGGSPLQFERFAQKALAATRATHGNKVYARIYSTFVPWELLQTNKHVQVEELRLGLIEYTQQPFHPGAFNNLQDFACAQKDETAYRFAGNLWLSYSSEQRSELLAPDSACREWGLEIAREQKK